MINSQILERIQATQDQQELRGQITGPLSKFANAKRSWDPFPIPDRNSDPIAEVMGTYRCIQKCIALAMYLELPVGALALDGSALISQAISDPNLKDMALALQDNAIDEENHYQAFEIASRAYDVPLEYFDQAQEFQAQVMALDEHPVLLAGFLELTVFFPSLAMLRKWGSSDLRNMTQYVSRDESAHVNTNFFIVDELSLKWNDLKTVDNLRYSIISWLTSDLSRVKELTSYWEKVSQNLRDTRQAPDLEWTKASQMVAFFETAAY